MLEINNQPINIRDLSLKVIILETLLFPFIQLPKIHQVQMERESSSVYMPLPKFSSKDIYKTNENRNFGHGEVECDIDKNSRRYFDNKPKKEPV